MSSIGNLNLTNPTIPSLGDLSLTETPIDPNISLYVNPDLTEKITDTLNTLNPMSSIENMNLMPDVSGLMASVKTSVGNFLSPLIAKTGGAAQAFNPYTIPISAGIGAGIVSGYYIGKKHGKLKGTLGGILIGGTTSLATGLAAGTIPLAIGAGAAGTLGLSWILKEISKNNSSSTPTATA